MQCSHCDVEMVPGFIPDFSGANAWLAVWIPGRADADKTGWEKFRSGHGIKIGDADPLAVEAHRCPRCKRLELFAVESVHPDASPAAR